jgi:Metallo-peptidase family M12B Reprolysin-like
MKLYTCIRSSIVLSIIATCIVASPLTIAADSSQLAGKNLGQNRDLVNAVMQGRSYVVEVDQQGGIKQVIDAGANGSGKDAQQVVALAEIGQKQETTEAPSSVAMPESYQGQLAIDYMGAELPKIAANYGLTEGKLKAQFLTDNTIHIDSTKHIFYVEETADESIPSVESAEGVEVADATTASGVALPIGSTPVTADAFKLHSKPGASKTIYLDFDGHVASGTFWSATAIQAPAFDLDANPAAFNDAERKAILSIWSRVAEDYIPFDVDITTEQPADSALIRESTADTVYGTRVVITKKGTISCTCGGIAYVNVVAMVNGAKFQPAWVFQESLGNSEKIIAEAVSHEAGHNLGLFHDGQKTATSTVGYYTGHGTGTTGWAPIMGVGYYKNLTQWSKGEYPNANNLQDDFAVLASNGFVQRTDDVGNTLATASPFNIAATATAQTTQKTGTIESSGDIDMYRLDTVGGTLNVSVNPVSTGPNLDTALTLLDGNGAVIAASVPESVLSATISKTITAGTYYLVVKGSARAAVGGDYGYPASASLGQYSLTGTYQSAGTVVTTTNVSSPAGGTTPSPVAKVFASSLKIKAVKGNNISAKVGVIVTNEKNERMPNAFVWGKWSGVFSGKVGKKAGANGEVTQQIAKKGKLNGGSATFTIIGIEAPGYVYSAENNAKSVVTVTW